MNAHFILTSGRSGSNFLSNLINSHPACVNFGEVLGPWTLPRRAHRLMTRGAAIGPEYLDAFLEAPSLYYAGQLLSLLAHLRRGRAPNFKFRSSVQSIGVKDFILNLERLGLERYLEERSHVKVVSLYVSGSAWTACRPRYVA